MNDQRAVDFTFGVIVTMLFWLIILWTAVVPKSKYEQAVTDLKACSEAS